MTPLRKPQFDTARPVGLLLSGGGARAAYQVGVLESIAQIRREAGAARCGNPFPIIAGSSAGAINAAALACGANDFDGAVRKLAAVWHDLRSKKVYRTDAYAMFDAAARWRLVLGVGQLIARWFRLRPRSLLDNAPLGELLSGAVPLERLERQLRTGHLQALSIAASSYSSGEHITFFQTRTQTAPWSRSQRQARPASIAREHLLASSAIPFVFPAQPLPMGQHTEYFGDGSMRQTAPISPVIHLGARRILAIGAGRMSEPVDPATLDTLRGDPTLAQIAGHALTGIFLDALEVDIERLRRINETLELIPEAQREDSGLHAIELLKISPSRPIDEIAARHTGALPAVVRRLLASGTIEGEDDAPARASALASYLLFEPGFTRELMALGRADALAQRDEVCSFFGWPGR